MIENRDSNIHRDISCWFKAFFLIVFPRKEMTHSFFFFRAISYFCYEFLLMFFIHFVSTFQVHWFQQQHERVRKKRDYAADLYSYQQKYGLLRSIAPSSRIQYRQVSEPLFFPDPFFKEQWYLVSTQFPYFLFYCLDKSEWNFVQCFSSKFRLP